MRALGTAGFAVALLLVGAGAAGAQPAEEPYRGEQPITDFPAPIWAETQDRSVWLDAKRERNTYPPCQEVYPGPTDQCGFGVGLPGSFFNPFKHTRAGLKVAVGDLVRFHLPAASTERPVVRTGVRLKAAMRMVVGGRVKLGTTEAPWLRITKRTRSGLASLTTETGTYWFKLSIRR